MCVFYSLASFLGGLSVGLFFVYLIYLKIGKLQSELTRLNLANKELAVKNELLEKELSYLEDRGAKLESKLNSIVSELKDLSASTLERYISYLKDFGTSVLGDKLAEAQKVVHAHENEVKRVIKPLEERLSELRSLVEMFKIEGEKNFGSIESFLRSVNNYLLRLEKEKQELVKALKRPEIRGRWGEIHLQNAVELAGMEKFCDFITQPVLENNMRPDLMIKLPGNKVVVVDSKVPLDAYFDAIEEVDTKLKEEKIKKHIKQIKSHISSLASKKYWKLVGSPEFVVMYIPLESCFRVAVEKEPELIEFGIKQGVLVCGPVNLVALLKTVYISWQRERVTEYAQEIEKLGTVLYERILYFLNLWAKLGESIKKSVDIYNKGCGTLQARVLPSLKKMKNVQRSNESPVPPVSIDVTVRGDFLEDDGIG